MALYLDCGLPLKIFVKEQNVIANDAKPTKKDYLPVNPLSGESAREFYESVINETSAAKRKSPAKQIKPSERNSGKSVMLAKFKSKDLHKLAQNNEFETLEHILRYNKDISVDDVDSFGWTPLMCAACSQSREAVEVLLRYKANPNICDKFGNSAVTLAKKKNFNIVELIKNCDSNKVFHKKKRYKSVKPIFCEMCSCEFNTDLKTHESSTLHLFNTKPKNPKTFYGIPDCNKGFQLLLKNGWNREKGLGPRECGRKFPVKVTKKSDRTGIGGETLASTNDMNTPERNQVNKRMTLCQEKREKCFERNFRLQFS